SASVDSGSGCSCAIWRCIPRSRMAARKCCHNRRRGRARRRRGVPGMAEQQHESQEPDLRGLLVAGAIISIAIALAVGIGLWLVSLFGGFERPLARAE